VTIPHLLKKGDAFMLVVLFLLVGLTCLVAFDGNAETHDE